MGAQWHEHGGGQWQGLVLAGTCPGDTDLARLAPGDTDLAGGAALGCAHSATGHKVMSPLSHTRWSKAVTRLCITGRTTTRRSTGTRSTGRTRLLFLTVTEKLTPVFNFHALNTKFWRHPPVLHLLSVPSASKHRC